MGLFEIAVVLAVLGVLVLGWLLLGMFGQIGRLLLRVDGLEQQTRDALNQRSGQPVAALSDGSRASAASPAPVPVTEQTLPSPVADAESGRVTDESASQQLPGFPPGTVLFDFELPDLDGRQTLRSAFNGRALLLAFVSPECQHSRALLADLAALRAAAPPSWPLPVLVSTGSRDENTHLAEQADLHEVILLQEEMEVADLLKVPATPMAYLVDEDGKTASPLVAGRVAVLGLAASTRRFDERYMPAPPTVDAQLRWLTTAAPSIAGIFERGLPVGAVAPGFVLPRTDGGTLSLDAYRGQRVVLVFVDPGSEPSDALADGLTALDGTPAACQIALIARGTVDAGRAWAAQHALTLPLGVQARWEVSRAYRLLAAPVAFLVDEQGTIAEGVAVGADAVLDLVRRASSSRG